MLSWDRSHDWEVQRFYNEYTHVTIRFGCGTPTIAELLAIRRCLPQFRNTPPAEVRVLIGSAGLLHLGMLPTIKARRVAEAARSEGLEVVMENASFISYLAYDRTTGSAWLIEDEEEARLVAEAMIAAGVPVSNIEE